VLVAVGALLAGVLIGNWSGRSGAHELQTQLDKVQAELDAEKKRSQSGLPLAMGLRSLMGAPERSEEVERIPPSPQSPSSGEDKAASTPGDAEDPDAAARPEDVRPQDRKEALETAAATWRLRSVQERTAFIERARLSEEQQASLKKVTDQLNQDVKGVLQQAMERIDFSKRPQTRDMVDLGVSLGEIYQDSDDELRHFLTEDQLGVAQEAEFDIVSQIDPDMLMPFLLRAEQAP